MKRRKLIRRLAIFTMLAGLISVSGCTRNDSGGHWTVLFNGKDINDWRIKIKGAPLNENYRNTFQVKDGKLIVDYSQYDQFDDRFGHIFYKEKFSSYLLAVEYRFVGNQVKGGPDWAYRNSGIMLHCQAPETMGLDQDFPISLEVQLLGGNGKDPRSTGNLCTPGTNVVMADSLVTDHCISSTSKTYAGDQWVRAEVLVLADSLIKHIIEGDTVLTYFKPQIGGGVISGFDPAVKLDGKLLTEGYISLQSESHPVEFRRVELYNLEPYMRDSGKLREVLGNLRTRTKP